MFFVQLCFYEKIQHKQPTDQTVNAESRSNTENSAPLSDRQRKNTKFFKGHLHRESYFYLAHACEICLLKLVLFMGQIMAYISFKLGTKNNTNKIEPHIKKCQSHWPSIKCRKIAV